MKIVIPKDEITISDRSLILAALPITGYKLGDEMVGIFEIFDSYNRSVGNARVVAGKVLIETDNHQYGDQFAKTLSLRFPKQDSDRILWKVFYSVGDQNAFCSERLFDSPDKALEEVFPIMIRSGAYLCSFALSEWDEFMCMDEGGWVLYTLKTLTTQKLDAQGQPEKDRGPRSVKVQNAQRT